MCPWYLSLQNGLSTTSLSSVNGPVDSFSGRGDGGVSQDSSGGGTGTGMAGPPVSSSAGGHPGGQSRKKVSAPGNMQPNIVRKKILSNKVAFNDLHFVMEYRREYLKIILFESIWHIL